jgi:raffinose/stachyose/melibiose transport system substrate-binding protein
MKKSLILVLIGLAVIFSACSKGSKEKTDGNGIVIFQSKVEITTQLEAAARAYQQESGVPVEVWSTTGDDYFHQLRTRIANNQEPTLFSVGFGTEVNQIANYLDNLGDLPFVKDIAAPMLGKAGDRIVGIPYTVEGFGLVYNKSLINPEAVRDYGSFVRMLQEQKAKGINGFGLSQESYFLIGHILNAPFAVMPNMEEYMDRLAKGQVKMADTPEFQEFARFYAAIRDNSYNPLEVNYDKECGDFATGKTASIHQGNWCYNMFADYNINFEMGLMPFPLGGNDKLAVSVPTVWAVNSQVPEAQRKLAKDFLTWLYTSETGKRFVTEEFGFIPVVKGMTSAKMDPLSAEVSRYATEGKTIPWATSLYPPGIVDVYLVPLAQQFFTSKMTPQEFLVGLDKAWAQANGR